MTKKFNSYCERSRHLALQSTMSLRHSTLVIYRNSIISEGINTDSRGYVRGNIIPSMHSEIQAVLHLSNRLKKMITVDLFVARYTKDNKPKMSRPCNLCIEILSKLVNIGIRRIYYFNENSMLVSERFRNMDKHYSTRGCKNFNL